MIGSDAMYEILNQNSHEAKITSPSDNLRLLYGLCEKHPSLAQLFELIPKIRLVIDTNIVIQELLFVTKSRRKNSARTVLREVLDSGVVVTIAPTKMHEEVNRHIPRLARERVVPEEQLRLAWLELQARIEFRDVSDDGILGPTVVDPDDIPFVSLYMTSGADAVLTRDKHISIMGAKTLGPEAMLHVRDYARSKSPEVTLRVGGVLIVGVAAGGVVALLKLIGAALRSFSKLTPELQFLLIGGVVFAALHPSTRRALSKGFSSVAASLRGPAGVFVEACGNFSLEIGAAQLDLKIKQSAVEGVIPRRSPSLLAFPTEPLINEKGMVKACFDPSPPLQVTKQRLTVPGARGRARRRSIRSKPAARRQLKDEQDSTP